MALPASDTFLQSSGSTQALTAYGSWAVLEGGFDVRSGSGRAEGTNSGGSYNTARWTGDTFGANHESTVTLDFTGAAVYQGPAVRCQTGANTSYHCETDGGGTVYISKCLAGSQSTLTTRSQACVTGDRLRLSVETVGGNAVLKVYHAAAASPTSFTQLGVDITDSSSPITTAGAAGIFIYNGSTLGGIADWEANNLAGPPNDPSNVTVGNLTTTGATIQWQDNSGDETGFDVEVALGPAFSSYVAVSGSPTSAGVTSIDVSGLTNGAAYRARVRAKNGAGNSNYVESEDFTLQTPVKLRPIADITVGSWTPSTGSTLYGVLDETSPDDNDYASIAGNGTMEVKFGTALDPGVSYGHTVRYRLQGDGVKSFTVRLMQGATIISTDPTVRTPPNGSWNTYSWTLTSTEADAITDYSDLRLRVVVS